MSEYCPFCRLIVAAGDRNTVTVGVVRVHDGCFKNHVEKPRPHPVYLKQVVHHREVEYG